MIFKSTLSVIPCRKEPADQSEMVTQLLYGEYFEALEKTDIWVEIKIIHDQYVCYIDRKQFDEAIETSNNISTDTIIKSPIYEYSVKEKSYLLFAGSIIPEKLNFKDLEVKELAMQYLNAPYLWGGRTIAGIDCSGYTQLIFRLRGKNIPRDAYQQAELGESITFIAEALTGDLAFFDNKEGRITHVGMVIKSNEETNIIHASGKVRIDQLDHHGIYDTSKKQYTHNLRIIKRISVQ